MAIRTITINRDDGPVEAKGRNGYFHVDRFDLWDHDNRLRIEAFSKVGSKTPPLVLEFGNPTALRALAHEWVQAAEALEDRRDPGGAGIKEAYREAARAQYGCDGEIEIHDDAVVSQGDDPGAYIAAWVWVYDETATEDNTEEE